MASSFAHHHLDSNNPVDLEELLIPSNPNNVSIARRTLVGKITASKTINKPAAKEITAKAWAAHDKLLISDLGSNKFLFTFENESSSKEVMKKAPWFIINHLVCIQFWNLTTRI